MPRSIDMIGRIFGKRIVIGSAPVPSWHTKPFWRARCVCGREDDVLGQALRNGKANQCRECQAKTFGERSTIHGHARAGKISPTFQSWTAMQTRCLNNHSHEWRLYGGRGITICSRWLGGKGFENFLADMGERPEGKTLDRFPDTNGNYEPSNCRWATPKEQIANQRHRKLIVDFTTEELLDELKRRNAI